MEIEGHIFDSGSGIFRDGALKITNGHITDVVWNEVGADAPFILPGLTDSHIHIESSLLLPHKFAELAVRHGVVCTIADPHEIANVLGIEGVRYMIADGKKAHYHFHFAASPCVPSTTFETAGASLNSKDIEELLNDDDIYGLGEMMNVPGVLFEDPETMAKIMSAKKHKKPIDGHAPSCTGKDLEKYCMAGVSTDHECTNLPEAQEKLRLGMKIILREGSAACDFKTLLPLMHDAQNADKIMFCSDDKYPDELLEGYIDDLFRMAVRDGVPVDRVIKAACINPTLHYGINTGMLRKGDKADFILVDSMESFVVQQTFIDGVKVYDINEGTLPAIRLDSSVTSYLPNNFHARPIQPSALQIAAQSSRVKVIRIKDGSLYTYEESADVKTENGHAISDTENDILKIVVYNRYTEGATPSIGFVKGFGIKNGAMATSIAHDSHNIVALGSSDEHICKAINLLVESHGGIAVINGEESAVLPLPVAGLMSERPGDDVAKDMDKLIDMAHKAGCPCKAPFMTMSFMALPVIPELKMTDKGLFEYKTFGFTSLFE